MKQPSLFLSHGGGPCFFLNENGPVPPEWRSMGDFLANVIADLRERPRALLVVSGHWEEPGFTVHRGERPDLLYDYGGFPEHTYALRWDAPGAPAVAREAARLIERAGFRVSEAHNRGWDQGVLPPLKVAVPASAHNRREAVRERVF